MKAVNDLNITENTTIKELINQFSETGGFSASKVAKASKIIKNMQSDKDCFKILSHPDCFNRNSRNNSRLSQEQKS